MKKVILSLLLAACLLCLTGCTTLTANVLSIVTDKASETGADALTRRFIDGVLANDPDVCLASMVQGVTMQSVLEVLPQMQQMLPPTPQYTLTPIHWSSETNVNATMHAFRFQLTMAQEAFLVETLQMSGVEGLYNIHISPYVPDEAVSASAHGEYSAVDLALTLLSIAEIILILWALVDCCRHKFKRRWMWILLILIGNLLLTFILAYGQMRLNFRIGIYLTGTWVTMSENGFSMQLMLPIGAFAYMLRRKHLLPPPSKGFAEAFSYSAYETVPTEETDSPVDPAK